MTELENERIRVLHALGLLDTVEEDRFDRITAFAADWFEAPISLISLVDQDRQWFKSHHGLGVRETPRAISFCAHAIASTDLFVVPDTWADPRFADNELVTGPPHIRFYAGQPIQDEQGWRLGTINIIDTEPRAGLSPTERKLLDALARWVEAEISLIETNALRVAASRVDDARTRFLGRVAHELRTPLNSVYGHTQLLQMHAVRHEDLEPTVEKIMRACTQLIDLIDQLLDVTVLETDELPISVTTVGVRRAVREAVDLCLPDAQRRDITLITDPGIDDLRVRADETRFVRVLRTLVANAVHHTEPGGSVTIGARAAERRVVVQVTDAGAGFTDEDLPRVFEPFDRILTVPRDDREPSGAGISLKIAQVLAERMGGTLGARSTPGRGTTFTLVLPDAGRI